MPPIEQIAGETVAPALRAALAGAFIAQIHVASATIIVPIRSNRREHAVTVHAAVWRFVVVVTRGA